MIVEARSGERRAGAYLAPIGFGTVIKIGGSVLRDPASFAKVVDALGLLVPPSPGRAGVLVVPGGGPFADAVRAIDAALAPGDDAAHWMAILGMDQHAHLLAARTPGADVVETPADARAAHEAGRLPILAPYRWLRERDPLPHSWAVSSDSIAAWIALDLGAPELILVKPVAGPVDAVTDPYFPRVLADAIAAGRRLRVRVTVAMAAGLNEKL